MVKKKLLSIFLCFAFLCSTLSTMLVITSSAEATVSTELVENGNFSDGSTVLSSQWSGVDSELELTSQNTYLGTKCLKVTPKNTNAKAVLTLKAKPNTKYLLHIGTNGSAQNFNYYINNKAIEFTNTIDGIARTEQKVDSAQKGGLTSIFTTPADTDEITVTFEKAGTFYLQRVYVTEYEADLNIDFSDGKIGNHYVSNSGSTWTVNTIEDDGANKYLKVHNNNNNWEMGPVFYMATVPGNNYKVSFDINTASRWAVFYITNSIWGNNAGIAQVAISEKLTDSDCGKWKTIEAEFTAKSYYTTFGFKLCNNLNSLCLDNINVVDVSDRPVELVENGNFSDGSTALSTQWTGIDSTLELTSQNTYLGTKCLKVTPKSTTAKAVLTLRAKPGTTYMLHIGTNGSAQNFTYYINNKAVHFANTADGVARTEQTVNAAQKSGLTSLFTTPDNNGKITITFEKAGAFYLQRVYVTEYGTDYSIDFSDGKIGNHYLANSGSTWTVNTIEDDGANKYLKVQNTRDNWEMGPVFYAATVPGNNYKITFDINTTSRWAVFYITNSIWGNNAGIAQVAISEKLTDADCGKWKTIEAEFTATTYFTTFGFKLSNNLSALCLDNISFKDNSEIPTELVENGNFSDGSTTLSSQWSGVDTSLEITDGGKYLGLYCLKATPNTTGGTAKANLKLKAKPNTQYLLHVATSSGWKNFNYYVNDKAISLTDTATQEVSTERSNVTTKNNNIQTSLFTSPEDGNVTVTFWYDGIFEIDRVYVTEYGTDMNIDFSNGKIGNHYVSNGGSTKTVNTIETEGSNKYLKVHNNNNNWEMGPVFYMSTVPDTIYDVSFDVNTTSRWAVLYITDSIWGNNAGISQVAISEKMTDADCGTWKTVTAQFTAKSHYTTFGFKLSNNLDALCIDNISVTEHQEGAIYSGDINTSKAFVNEEDNLISNQSLNDGLSGSFANMPQEFTVSNDGFCDSTALNFKSTGSQAGHYINLENITPATEYTLSFYAKVIEQSDLKVAIMRNNSGKDIRNAVEIAFTKVGDYALCGYTFNSDVDTELYLYIGGSNGHVVLDDIAVFESSKGIAALPNIPYIDDWKANDKVLGENGVNLLTNGSFENGSDFADGNVVNTQANSGSKSLEFAVSGEEKLIYAQIDVEPNTIYYFSTYVKGIHTNGDKDITFGVYNPRNGEFFAIPSNYVSKNDEIPDSTSAKALTPPAYDGEWYKRAYTVNTKGLTSVYIVIKGVNGTAYFDDMLLCKLSDTVDNIGQEGIKGTTLSTSKMGCSSSANLIKNYSFQAKDNSEWSSITGYDKFLTVKEVVSGDWALVTAEKAVGTGVYYIRWIDVKPNTNYNFSVMARQISKESNVSFGLFDNSSKYNIVSAFSNVSADWNYYGSTFNSGSNNKIGIFICDTGVEAQYDNFRLFESSNAKSLDSAELAAKTVTIVKPEDNTANTTVTDKTEENVKTDETDETGETEKIEEESVKNTKKIKVSKTVIPGTPGGLSTVQIVIIICAWVLLSVALWLVIGFFTKTSVFSKRKKM